MTILDRAKLTHLHMTTIVLHRSCSSKIQPVLFDASPSPSLGGIVVLRTNKIAMEKMAIINTLGLVLINGRCINYITANGS